MELRPVCEKIRGKSGFFVLSWGIKKSWGGNLMKITRLALIALVALMLSFTSAQAGFYLGVHGGPNFPTASNAEATGFNTTFSLGNLAPKVGYMVGGQFGYDFLTETQDFPAWTKYLSVALDFTATSLVIPGKSFTFQRWNTLYYGDLSETNGTQLSLNFMVLGKLPLMETQEFPHGRLFPYIGIGPSLVWSVFSNTSSFDLGFVVEPGVRFQFAPHLSGDLAYRFLYVSPEINPSGSFDKLSWNTGNHSVVFRVSYHF
jgi:opacity protein-like surface antigen